MKRFSIFESAIIGLLIGVVVATYVIFIDSTEGFLGQILSWISLLPFLDWLNLPIDKSDLVIPFLFVTVVFVIHGTIIGLIAGTNRQAKMIIASLLILLPISIIFEQIIGNSLIGISEKNNITYVASAIKSLPQKDPGQYFGNEARGDLNDDGQDDIAFIIPRSDKERGTLYYLVSSLKSEVGYTGTNLLYLGEKIHPNIIGIEKGIIFVDYSDLSSKKKASTTKQFFAEVVGGELREIKIPF